MKCEGGWGFEVVREEEEEGVGMRQSVRSIVSNCFRERERERGSCVMWIRGWMDM